MSLLMEYELEKMYDDFLDEINPEVSIGSLTYLPSNVLKNVDPTAYRCGFADWLDAEVTEGHLFEQDGEYYDEDPSEEATI